MSNAQCSWLYDTCRIMYMHMLMFNIHVHVDKPLLFALSKVYCTNVYTHDHYTLYLLPSAVSHPQVVLQAWFRLVRLGAVLADKATDGLSAAVFPVVLHGGHALGSVGETARTLDVLGPLQHLTPDHCTLLWGCVLLQERGYNCVSDSV